MHRQRWPSWAKAIARRLRGTRASRKRLDPSDLVKKYQTSLRNGLKGSEASNGEQDTTFMTRYMVQKVIKREDIRDLLHTFRWYHDSQTEDIYNKFLCIIATLITIDWKGWADFDRLFLSHKKGNRFTRCDDQLPFRLPSDLEFFSSEEAWREFFFRKQFIYSPIVLKENDHCEYRADQRLPFLTCEERSRGGYSVVSRVLVPKFQIEYAKHPSLNHDSRYYEEKIMALKVARDEDSFNNERAVNESFKKALTRCEAISSSFGSFKHGSTLNTLYQWAELDLADLLSGEYESVFKGRVLLTPHILVSQLLRLSDGLHFMHNKLDIDGPKKCSHFDLKPNNILIFLVDDGRRSDGEGSTMAMDWKIGDFGLSVLSNRDESQNPGRNLEPETLRRPSMVEYSSLPAPRPPGPFQAPEMKAGSTVNRSTDMWSFGCILCVVLAFILGGPLEVHTLFMRRKQNYTDDYFWTTRADGSVIVKPEIEDWLDLQERNEESNSSLVWIRRTTTLVRQLLEIDKTLRLKATETQAGVQEVLGAMTETLPIRWSLPSTSDLSALRRSYRHDSATKSSNLDTVLLEDHAPSHPRGAYLSADAAKRQLQPKSRLSTLLPSHLNRLETPTQLNLARTPDWPTPATSAQYCRVSVPPKTFQSVLSTDAGCVSFCNDKCVYLYDLQSILDRTDLFMADEKQCSLTDGPVKSAFSPATTTYRYVSVLLAGPFVGLQMASEDDFNLVEIHKRGGPSFQTDPITTITLGPGCLEAKLSSRGGLLLRYEHKLDIWLLDPFRREQLPLDDNQSLVSATFSPDGLSIGAWYTTENRDNWCMWEIGTDKITRKQWQYAPRNRPGTELRENTTARYLVPGSQSHTFFALTNSGQIYYLSENGHERLETSTALYPGTYAAVCCSQGDALLLLTRQDDTRSHAHLVRTRSDNDLHDRVKHEWSRLVKHPHGTSEGLVPFTDPAQSGFLTSFVDGSLVKQPFPHDAETGSDHMEIEEVPSVQ